MIAATSATAAPRNGVFARRGQTSRIARAMPQTARVSKGDSASSSIPSSDLIGMTAMPAKKPTSTL